MCGRHCAARQPATPYTQPFQDLHEVLPITTGYVTVCVLLWPTCVRAGVGRSGQHAPLAHKTPRQLCDACVLTTLLLRASLQMTKKRRNGGRSRHGRGHTRMVDCDHCGCKPPKVRGGGAARAHPADAVCGCPCRDRTFAHCVAPIAPFLRRRIRPSSASSCATSWTLVP